MAMMKQDFEALAGAIKATHNGSKRTANYKSAVAVVNKLLPYLRSSNRAFDNDRFIKACGLDVKVPTYNAVFDERFALCA